MTIVSAATVALAESARPRGATSTMRSARHLLRDACLDERVPNENPARTTGRLAILGAAVGQRGQRIIGFAGAVVECAGASADAAKIESDAGVAQRRESLRQRLHDLVVHRPALQRMRVRDQRNAARRLLGQIERELERAGRPGDRHTLFAARHQR